LPCLDYENARTYTADSNSNRDYHFLTKDKLGPMGLVGVRKRGYKAGIGPIPLREASNPRLVGTKSAHQCRLIQAGFNVPDGIVLPFTFRRKCLLDPGAATEQMREALSTLVTPGRKYCVRSSVSVEDGEEFSYAGQFETYLDLDSPEAVIRSVLTLFANDTTTKANGYRGWDTGQERLVDTAVLIQEMIDPVLAGVVFTRNPVTGMDEVIVESVPSCGVALMQHGVTPSRWIWKWGRWKLQGDTVDEPTVRKVVEGARRIARMANGPVDAEWAFDGEKIYWLQYRSITALRAADVYSNRIAREQLPGLIKPLIWSINIPVVCGAWKRIFLQLLGQDAACIDINRMARPFCFRAYYNMGIVGDVFELLGMPRESTELMMGMDVPGTEPPRMTPGARSLRYLPRMTFFATRMLFFGHSIRRFLGRQWRTYETFDAESLAQLGSAELIQRIDSLMNVNIGGAYYVILSQLLMGIYNGLFKRMLTRRGIPYDERFFHQVSRLVRDVDPTYHLSVIATRRASREHAGSSADLDTTRDIEDFLERFGHLSESGNDFSRPTWREEPEMVLRMLHNQQTGVPQSDEPPTHLGQPILRLLRSRAVAFRSHREHVNFCYTFGYGLLRPHFMRLGQLMVDEGWLDASDDIFMLSYDEVREVWATREGTELRHLVKNRRDEMERCREVVLPEVIVGDTPPVASSQSNDNLVLTGVAASGGLAAGPAQVVRGLAEAETVEVGDVLVIPYSDVSWTPLFNRVSAIVSEAGGLLSHCSIVAREHGIPAVVSVEGAMQIPEGVRLLVDGNAGTVSIDRGYAGDPNEQHD